MREGPSNDTWKSKLRKCTSYAVPNVCVDCSTYNTPQSATRSTGSRYYDAGFVSTGESNARLLKVFVCKVFALHDIIPEICMSMIPNMIRTKTVETLAMIAQSSNLMPDSSC
jgi:hypothetical protein